MEFGNEIGYINRKHFSHIDSRKYYKYLAIGDMSIFTPDEIQSFKEFFGEDFENEVKELAFSDVELRMWNIMPVDGELLKKMRNYVRNFNYVDDDFLEMKMQIELTTLLGFDDEKYDFFGNEKE